MSVPEDYEIDFDSDELPVWFIPDEGTIAYHLYPRCGHIDQRMDYELKTRTVAFDEDEIESMSDFTDQIESGRHMCGHCLDRFQKDLFEFKMG